MKLLIILWSAGAILALTGAVFFASNGVSLIGLGLMAPLMCVATAHEFSVHVRLPRKRTR
jgi:hypothetical protein